MRRNSIRNSIGPKITSLSKQRNIRDPSYKAQCIQKLSSFLGNLDPKSLELPSIREFQSIFKHFYSQFEQSTDLLDSRFEDEAINFLKTMKYPYMTEITKSQLITISPHSWPALLSMLTWLCDISSFDFAKNEEESVDSLFHESVCDSFKEFMQTGKENKDRSENFLKKTQLLIKKKKEESENYKNLLKNEKEKSIHLLNKKINDLSTEIKSFKEQKAKDLPQLTATMKYKKEELVKKYNYDLEKLKELESKTKERILEKDSLSSEVNFYDEEVKKYKEVIENFVQQIQNQGITKEEISDLRNKRENDSNLLEELIRNENELILKKKEKERESESLINEIQKSVSKTNIFNKKFYFNESSDDSENKMNSINDSFYEINEENVFEKDLFLLINKLKENLNEFSLKSHLAVSERNTLSLRKNELSKQIDDFNTSITGIKEENLELSNDYVKIKENFDMVEKRNKKEIEALRKGVDKLSYESQERFYVAEKEFQVVQTKLDLSICDVSKKDEEWDKVCRGLVEGVTDRLCIVDDLLKKVEEN